MSVKTFEKLTALLDEHQARYRLVEHPTAGKSEEVAKIRGTELGQWAKALVCKVKGIDLFFSLFLFYKVFAIKTIINAF